MSEIPKYQKYQSLSRKTFVLFPKVCVNCNIKFYLEMGRKYITAKNLKYVEYFLCKRCSCDGAKQSDYIFHMYQHKLQQSAKKIWSPPTGISSSVYKPPVTNNNEIKNDCITIIKKGTK